jgi:hypothetical protein
MSPGITLSKHSRMLASSACDWLLRAEIRHKIRAQATV